MPVAFYDPTNPRTREFIWSVVKRNYHDRRRRASGGWTPASRRSSPATTRTSRYHAGPGRRGGRHLPARQRAHCSPRAWRPRHGAEDAETVLLCRSAWAGQQQLRRRRVVGRHRRRLGTRCASRCAAGLSIAHRRHPLVDDRHRRLPRRRRERRGLPRAGRPLVPVRRVLPPVPPARRPRAAHAARAGT